MLACKKGDEDKAREVVEQGANVNTRSAITGRTALHEACAGGHFHLATWLIKECNADIHRLTRLGGESCLHLACKEGGRSLVFMLLQRGCDPNMVDKYHMTPLHCAEDHAVAVTLLRYGGRPCVKDALGRSPMDTIKEKLPKDKELHAMLTKAHLEDQKERVKEEYGELVAREKHIMARKRAENAQRKAVRMTSSVIQLHSLISDKHLADAINL
ncbi:unnamed protein product [Chrysoparadoxa australica]